MAVILIEDSSSESPDWTHMLQTQAATEEQVQTMLETQVYHPDQMWGQTYAATEEQEQLQLETQVHDAVQMWGSGQDLLETQVYHADQMWGLSEDQLAASYGRRVQKKAKPMAISRPRLLKKKPARAVKKRLVKKKPSKHGAE